MVNYLIRNGIVVTPSGSFFGGIAVKGEKISYMGEESGLPEAKNVIDANGKFIIPGFVEPHCHFDVGPPELSRDDTWQKRWKTESESAIHGGVTTIRSCLTLTKQKYLPVIDKYIKWASESSYADFGIYPSITMREHLDELIPMAERGMPSWKAFFEPYQGEEGRQVGVSHTDSGMLYEVFEKLGKFGYPGMVMIHAEEYNLYTMLQKRIMKTGQNDLKAWSNSRPNICETMKIYQAALICEEVGGAPLYIVHMSTKEGVDICQEFQRRGVPIIAEVLACHLVHTKHDGEKIGVWGKINPPFREKEDVKRMWEGLRTGVVKCVGTDHCAYTQEIKEAGLGQFGDIWKAMPGLSGGNQHWLPVMMTYGFQTGRLSMEEIVRICCENNAKIFGLYPRKGVLAVGSDADIAIVDPEKEETIGEGFYRGINKNWSDMWGKKIKGMPVMAMIRGKVVMRDGKTVGEPGYGKFIPSKKY